MALLSHILYDWRSPNHLILRPQMLDNPKKTEPLLVALKAAVPFEVELMPALIEHLRVKNIATLDEIRQQSRTSPMLAMKAALCAILSHRIYEKRSSYH
jgi:D-ribose pyranose/furanose isomerase RbsD